MIEPKIILVLKKNSKFSNPPTANFWLHAGDVASLQWLEKKWSSPLLLLFWNVECFYLDFALEHVEAICVWVSNYIAESRNNIIAIVLIGKGYFEIYMPPHFQA